MGQKEARIISYEFPSVDQIEAIMEGKPAKCLPSYEWQPLLSLEVSKKCIHRFCLSKLRVGKSQPSDRILQISLIQVIIKLRNNPELRDILDRNDLRAAIAKYNWPNQKKELLELYEYINAPV